MNRYEVTCGELYAWVYAATPYQAIIFALRDLSDGCPVSSIATAYNPDTGHTETIELGTMIKLMELANNA
jgi:hypothetical protein